MTRALALRVGLGIVVGFALLGVVAPADALPALSSALTLAPAVLGLALLLGYTGQLSLGQAGLVGTGAYTTAILVSRFEVNHLLATVIAAVVTMAVAALASPILRLRGLTFALATLALGTILVAVFENGGEWTGGPNGYASVNTGYRVPYLEIFGVTFASPGSRYAMVLVAAILALLFCWNLVRGRSGDALVAVATDEDAAQAMGIPTLSLKVRIWLISAALSSLSGSLMVFYSRFASPDQFDIRLSALFVACVIAGGSASLLGPMVALAILSIPAEVIPVLSDYSALYFGLVIIIVLVFAPGGLTGLTRRVRDTWRRRRGAARGDGDQGAAEHRQRRSDPARPAATREPADRAPSSPDAVLSARGVSVSFGGLRAVDDASLDAYAGQILGLIGPNGAGKTTLVNAITGMVSTRTGELLLLASPVGGVPPHQRAARGLRRTFQNVRLIPSLTVYRNVRLGAYSLGSSGLLSDSLALSRSRKDNTLMDAEADRAIQELGLAPYEQLTADSLPAGVRRQVEVARAMATRPAAIILDEPAAGLNDVETTHLQSTIEDLARSGAAVVLIEHDLDLVMRVCDRIVVMHKGQVIANGTPSEIRADATVRAVYLGGEAPEPDQPVLDSPAAKGASSDAAG